MMSQRISDELTVKALVSLRPHSPKHNHGDVRGAPESFKDGQGRSEDGDGALGEQPGQMMDGGADVHDDRVAVVNKLGGLAGDRSLGASAVVHHVTEMIVHVRDELDASPRTLNDALIFQSDAVTPRCGHAHVQIPSDVDGSHGRSIPEQFDDRVMTSGLEHMPMIAMQSHRSEDFRHFDHFSSSSPPPGATVISRAAPPGQLRHTRIKH